MGTPLELIFDLSLQSKDFFAELGDRFNELHVTLAVVGTGCDLLGLGFLFLASWIVGIGVDSLSLTLACLLRHSILG